MNDWQEYNSACYIPGRPWAVCDRCAMQFRHDTLAKEWTGLLVCRSTCLDPRPPQLDAPNVYPEGVPIQDPCPDFEQSGPNTTTPADL